MRSWIVIPAMGGAGAAIALALVSPAAAIAAGLAGAAVAAAMRALAGESPAALAGAAIAPVLAIVSLIEHGAPLAPACLALAAACWTITELARPTTSPLVAMLPAVVAAVLEPATVALVAIAGARLVTAPWPRPRWVIAVPIAGVIAIGVALLAGMPGGPLPGLGARWFGGAPAMVAPGVLATRVAEALGPLAAVAALAGLAIALRAFIVNGAANTRLRAFRPRRAELALVAWIAGAVLVDLRAGTIGAATFGLAALCAGLAVTRLAALIRLGAGQAVVAATAGVLLVVPPAWIAVEHGPAAATSR